FFFRFRKTYFRTRNLSIGTLPHMDRTDWRDEEDFGAAAQRLLAKLDERARKNKKVGERPYAPNRSTGGAVYVVRCQREAGSANPSPQLSASLTRRPWVANDNRKIHALPSNSVRVPWASSRSREIRLRMVHSG